MSEYQVQNPNEAPVITKWLLDGAEIDFPFSLGVGSIDGVNYDIRATIINGGEVYLFQAIDQNREILDMTINFPTEMMITFQVSLLALCM